MTKFAHQTKTIQMPNTEKNTYPNRIRVILAEKQITNRWLAEKLGVTDITVSRWSTNKIQPSMSQFVDISKVLDVQLCDLIDTTLVK